MTRSIRWIAVPVAVGFLSSGQGFAQENENESFVGSLESYQPSDDAQDLDNSFLESQQVAQENKRRVLEFQELLQSVAFVPTKVDLEQLDVSNVQEGSLVYLEGYMTQEDGAEGFFWLDLDNPDLEVDDGVIIQATGDNNFWRRVYDGGAVNVQWFGATGKGYPNDDYPAILKAVSKYNYVQFPAGEYYVSTPIPFAVEQRFEGLATISSVNDHGALIVGETDCFVSTQLGSNRDVNWFNLAMSSRSGQGAGIVFDEDHTSGWNGNPIIQDCIFFSDLKRGITGTIQGGTIFNCGFGTIGSQFNMTEGIYLDNVTENTSMRILASKFRYMDTGILLERSNGIKITGCEFEMVKGVPVWLKGSASVTISDSYFENCRTDASQPDGFIRLDSDGDGTGCKGTVILGNYFLNNGGNNSTGNINSIIDGQWVTGATVIANWFGLKRSGIAIYNQGARQPAFSAGNMLLSNSYPPIDAYNKY